MHRTWAFTATILAFLMVQIGAIPASPVDLVPRTTTPYFPDVPSSCPICAASYPNISSCAAACYIFANVTEVLFDPSGFLAVIECSCTDTFESVFPQCVDCFIQTNQTDVLQSPNLPSVVSGLRTVCALASTLLGGVASADGQVPPTTTAASIAAATATDGTTSNSTSAALRRFHSKKLVAMPGIGVDLAFQQLAALVLMAGVLLLI